MLYLAHSYWHWAWMIASLVLCHNQLTYRQLTSNEQLLFSFQLCCYIISLYYYYLIYSHELLFKRYTSIIHSMKLQQFVLIGNWSKTLLPFFYSKWFETITYSSIFLRCYIQYKIHKLLIFCEEHASTHTHTYPKES